MEPFIPYIHIPSLKLIGPLKIEPFGVLVGIAIVVAYSLARRRARFVGLDPDVVGDACVWGAVSGFIFGHLSAVLFYYPERVLENPLSLLMVWDGLSSVGGALGGAFGVWLFVRKHALSMREFADTIIFGVIPGWIFGRAGCAVVHDHPGAPSDFFLAIKNWPATSDMPMVHSRHDLGLYGMFALIILSIILYALRKKRPFWGFHPGLMLMLYAPVRFCFDYLRVPKSARGLHGDVRYLGLTPAQFIAIGMFLFGVALMVHGLRLKKKGDVPPPVLDKPAPLPEGPKPTAKKKAGGSKSKSKRKRSK